MYKVDVFFTTLRFSQQADLIISLTLFTVGATYTLFPWSPTVWSLGVLDFIFSVCWGLYQAGQCLYHSCALL